MPRICKHRWGRNQSRKEGEPQVICVLCKLGFDAWQKIQRDGWRRPEDDGGEK